MRGPGKKKKCACSPAKTPCKWCYDRGRANQKKEGTWERTRPVGCKRLAARRLAVEARKARKEAKMEEAMLHKMAKQDRAQRAGLARARRWKAIKYNASKHGWNKAFYIADIIRRVHTKTFGVNNLKEKQLKSERVAARKSLATK